MVIGVLALCSLDAAGIRCARFPEHTLGKDVGGYQQHIHSPSQYYGWCLVCVQQWGMDGWGGASGQHSPVLLKVVLQSAASLTNVSPLGTKYLIATPIVCSGGIEFLGSTQCLKQVHISSGIRIPLIDSETCQLYGSTTVASGLLIASGMSGSLIGLDCFIMNW